MNLRLQSQSLEKCYLSEKAVFSEETKGRLRPEEECQIRTPFQRDRDRILHSKAFRRLKHKTQVFISPEGDHYRTRLTHTLEVSQISRTVARGLRLNEDLTEAIALGHDLGHTPFGHAGEDVLNDILPEGFHHNDQSLRVVDFLEKDSGLNLTFEVRDGIKTHSKSLKPSSLEGEVVKICDRIAYINHDIDDALRGEVIVKQDLPEACVKILGLSSNERINNMVSDLIYHNQHTNSIKMSREVKEATEELRQFLFDKVYIGSRAKVEDGKARGVIKAIYNYFVNNSDKLPQRLQTHLARDGVERVVCDYIAGMTDRYIIELYRELHVPQPWKFKQEE